MIAQFRTLGQVKKLREDKAMRALEKARATLAEAKARATALEEEVARSAASLPERERGDYRPILNTAVSVPDLDAAKDRVLALAADHRALCDKRDRALEYVKRCQTRLEEARLELRRRQTETEKIESLRAEMGETAELEAVAQEDAEIEDLFARPVRQPATEGADP
jgi:chromosome segregation ATPase